MKTAYLALGSNLGDRAANILRALQALHALPQTGLVHWSAIYETEPVGVREQPPFYNLVTEARTELGAAELLAHALEIEARLGRVRRERWGPRVLDIDLLWYDDQRIASGELLVPHPRMLERAFVLIPLAEIAPRLVIDGETVAARAARLPDAGIRRCTELEWPSRPSEWSDE